LGFGDALEAAQRATLGAPPRTAFKSGGKGQTPLATAAGTTAQPLAPAADPLGSSATTPPANTPVRSHGHQDADPAPQPRPASDHPPTAAATNKPGGSPAALPDPLAGAAILAVGQQDAGATVALAEASQPAGPTATPVAAHGVPSQSTGSGITGDLAATFGTAETSPTALAATPQTILPDTSSAGAGREQALAGTATGSAVLATAGQAILAGTPGIGSGGRPAALSGPSSAGKNNPQASAAPPASDTAAPPPAASAQRMIWTAPGSIGLADSPDQAVSPGDGGTMAADAVPSIADDTAVPGPMPVGADPLGPGADAGPADANLAEGIAGVTGSIASIAQLAGREAIAPSLHQAGATLVAAPLAAGAPGTGSQSVNPQTAAPQSVDPSAAGFKTTELQVGAARSPATTGSPAPSVASQVAPALISMAQGGGVGGRLSVSITPDQLGQVHITVERATDGTTSIHVAAEQLGTLDMLRHDQGDLTRALDQAGVGQQGHSLSFSWEGGGSGMQGWGSPGWSGSGWGGSGDQPGGHPPGHASGSYAAESTSVPSAAAATARGGIDLTA
jgi:hypothetical protein